jgi:hypothetical protein
VPGVDSTVRPTASSRRMNSRTSFLMLASASGRRLACQPGHDGWRRLMSEVGRTRLSPRLPLSRVLFLVDARENRFTAFLTLGHSVWSPAACAAGLDARRNRLEIATRGPSLGRLRAFRTSPRTRLCGACACAVSNPATEDADLQADSEGGSDGTRTRDLRRDRPAQPNRLQPATTRNHRLQQAFPRLAHRL